MKFDVVKANIVNVPADAIVLPAKKNLEAGKSGSSKAIFEAAGKKELTEACKKLKHCDVGSAVPTLAFNLDANYIIHAVVPKWIDGKSNEYGLLSSAYLSALNIADALHCQSIAFPLLASGNMNFDSKLAVQIAKESIGRFTGENLKKVILVVYDSETEDAMKSLGYTIGTPPKRSRANKQKTDYMAKAQKFMQAQLAIVYEWLKDPNNRSLLLQYGTMIAEMVLGAKLPQVVQVLRNIGKLPNAPVIPALEGKVLEEE